MIGVCIVTYNQEQYIAQAIESVLMQENCGHKVVAYVGNDCSTDKTGEICYRYAELYPDRVYVVNNPKNLGLVGNTMNLLDIMRHNGCGYIAMLDGDDYWSDPKKLQKQMAYLNAHPEYGLVHTCIDLLYPNKLVTDKRTFMPEGNVFHLIGDYPIGNCSVVFKTELLNMIDFEDFQQHGLQSCDYAMYGIFASKTQFGFMPEHTAVWRRGIESVSGTADMEKQIRYVQNDLAHWRYLAKLFPLRWQCSEQDAENYLHKRSFAIAFRFGNRVRALQEAKQMSHKDKQRNKWKILAAHSSVMTTVWNKIKKNWP